jgi:DNA modification methylase
LELLELKDLDFDLDLTGFDSAELERYLADVERLIAGQAADMVFTDLPYNCGYEGYTKENLRFRTMT